MGVDLECWEKVTVRIRTSRTIFAQIDLCDSRQELERQLHDDRVREREETYRDKHQSYLRPNLLRPLERKERESLSCTTSPNLLLGTKRDQRYLENRLPSYRIVS